MKFLRLPLYVLLLWLSGTALSQSELPKADAKKPATQSEIVLIGEMHGTQETPRLFGNLVTVAAGEKGKRVAAGLELPIAVQSLIDESVKKNTDIDSFRQQLFAHPAWQKLQGYQDGRGSQAMLDLICDLLRLAQSQQISFFFFDTEVAERNETMAKAIAQRARDQHYDVAYILVGNIHANRASHHPGRPKIVPMGHFLEDEGFTVHSYVVRYGEGETWACMPECGVHHLEASPAGTAPPGFDGILFVGPVHASPIAHGPAPAKGGQ